MTWVKFETVRENLDFAEVLAHFGFQTKANGQDQVKIHCPFHDDSNPSCGVNFSKKLFQCWSCKAKGNVLDFFARMEGYDPDVPKELRKAALAAVEAFGIDGGSQEAKSGNQPKAKAKPSKSSPRAPRVIPNQATPEDTFLQFWTPLRNLGCTFESAYFGYKIYAVDVPATVNIHEVYRLLKRGEDEGVWGFDEGHCGHVDQLG